MSSIPYQFFPIPPELMTDEFIDDPLMMRLIRYIFKRIRTKPHIEKIKSNGWHNVSLQAFEFIFGREKCKKETGLTDREIRTRMEILATSSFVSKPTSSSTSSFSVHRLMTESFNKNSVQQFDQQNDQQFDHKQENRENRVPALCLKETNKEKIVHNSAVNLSLSQKQKGEEQIAIEAFLESRAIIIDGPTIKRWLKDHGEEKIIKTITYMLKKQTLPNNPGGWITKALRENYAQQDEWRLINRDFAIKYKAERNIISLKLNKNYCIDKETGNDYQYSLQPEMFEREIRRKYAQ